MKATMYINAPFSRSEHDAIEDMAKREGRSKGQQLRILALKAIGFDDSKPIRRKKQKEAAR